jgi:hypothetical protein
LVIVDNAVAAIAICMMEEQRIMPTTIEQMNRNHFVLLILSSTQPILERVWQLSTVGTREAKVADFEARQHRYARAIFWPED